MNTRVVVGDIEQRHAGSLLYGSNPASVVELNVGGVVYMTSVSTLLGEPGSLLGELFNRYSQDGSTVPVDKKGRYFLDRDGLLFRYVLDYMRNRRLILPECFHEKERLRHEAEYFRLPGMLKCIQPECSLKPSSMLESHETINGSRSKDPGYLIVGYRGTFAFGRDGCQADVKFRKLWRILVSGRVALCREVFKDTLNESRDVDRGTSDRYTSRFFLKHTFIEQAFDMLQEAGFRLVSSCASGTNSARGDIKPGMDSEESKWNHYNEFIFNRQ